MRRYWRSSPHTTFRMCPRSSTWWTSAPWFWKVVLGTPQPPRRQRGRAHPADKKKKKKAGSNQPLAGPPTAAATVAGGGHGGPRGDKLPCQPSNSNDGSTKCPVHNSMRHTAVECREVKKLVEQFREKMQQ
jgi:hypothetical protein